MARALISSARLEIWFSLFPLDLLGTASLDGRCAWPRPALAFVLLSWLPRTRSAAMRSVRVPLTGISPGPPKNALRLTADALGSGLARVFVPQAIQGQKRRNHNEFAS